MWINWQLYFQQIYIRFHVYHLFKKTPEFYILLCKIKKNMLQIIGFWQVSTNSHILLSMLSAESRLLSGNIY
jgi:hypothetical protein